MLHQWAPLNPKKQKRLKQQQQKETPEQRENRLRVQYQNALGLHGSKQLSAAQRLLAEIAEDLSTSTTPPIHVPRVPSKRPRKSSQQWERRLRFAVNRNLAQVQYELEDYSSSADTYVKALNDDPTDFLVWIHAAQSASFCGRLHVARRAYETALKMRPAHLLCKTPFAAVLHAIADADDDVHDPTDESTFAHSKLLLSRRHDAIENQAQDPIKELPAQEKLHLRELTWACLVDALRMCLERRLKGTHRDSDFPIGHPVSFITPAPPKPVSTAPYASSDEVLIVSETSSKLVRPPNPQLSDDEVQIISDSSRSDEDMLDVEELPIEAADGTRKKTSPEKNSSKHQTKSQVCFSVQDTGASQLKEEDDKATNKETPVQQASKQTSSQDKNESNGAKKPDLRRSSRPRTSPEAFHDTDRRQTRNTTGALTGTQVDSNFIQALLNICLDREKKGDSASPIARGKRNPFLASESNAKPKNLSHAAQHKSSWTVVIDESTEAREVSSCLSVYGINNSGPVDLLLRLLEKLSKMKIAQYSSTLALVWAILRERLQLHMPNGPEAAALIAESLIASGRKASKAKATRFNEAARILSQIKVIANTEKETKDLRMRIAWSWAVLYECQGEMQLSFTSTECALQLLESLECQPKDILSESVGPEMSGFSCQDMQDRIRNRLFRLKGARDLEKANEELRKAKHGDKQAAKRTISILSASIHASIKSLELDQWSDHDLKTEFTNVEERDAWEARVDAEVVFEPRLIVCGRACAIASDVVSELLCKAVRLRMGVHYYASHLRKELEEGPAQPSSSVADSESTLAELLVQIRQFVMIIKRIVSSPKLHISNSESTITQWSLHKAASVASITLIALTKLLITKIPTLKFSSGVDMGGSRKNRRLGFTRCMLAFVRCISILEACENGNTRNVQISGESQSNSITTRNMLYSSVVCLKALVSRGCCREEGTSGALMKLYRTYLDIRLKELSARLYEKKRSPAQRHEFNSLDQEGHPNQTGKTVQQPKPHTPVEATCPAQSGDESEEEDDDTHVTDIDNTYEWKNVGVIRQELAQCYQVLYQIPDLEYTSSGLSSSGVRWLEEGCRVSKHLGLSFSSADPVPQTVVIDSELCSNVYFLYRRRIFEMFCNRRRDGAKVKRLRDLLNRLAEALPQSAPEVVPMLPFATLDMIINEAFDAKQDVSQGAAESVSKLENEWTKRHAKKHGNSKDGNTKDLLKGVEFSVLYFEVFSLHAMASLSVYEADYKKQKSAERRKGLKEAVERVITASNECAVALRTRPWSIGAWILLGRICLELADLALDERELSLSSFGLCRTEDLHSLSAGEKVSTIFGRAEACFGFAESLLRHPWAERASYEKLPLSSALILGRAYDGESSNAWCGFGDDGDLFGSYGMTNDTTSRPLLLHENHPEPAKGKADSRRLAAIRFGGAALSILRLRELRYFHFHWNLSTFELKDSGMHREAYPRTAMDIGGLALQQLKDAQHLYGVTRVDYSSTSSETAQVGASEDKGVVSLPWRQEHMGLSKMTWYYSLLEARLMRKTGRAPREYLPIFHRALQENKKLRAELKQPADIEPLYQLHSNRMKILRFLGDDASAIEVLNLLERFTFSAPVSISVDDVPLKDVEDWVADRKIAVAEDILSAMQFCSSKKTDVPHAEFYFKSIYCRAVMLAEVLKDTRAALEEIAKCFRMDAAVKALDQGPDAAHRGYFYRLWNYRFTDTGMDPSIETERELVRWRSKMLGFYGRLLKTTGDWRTLAAGIFRLKKRNAEDLPVDGAVLDDFIDAYAHTSRAAVLTSLEKSIVTDVAAFEASYQRTWLIFVESLRLSQGVRRVRVSVHRGENNETGSERLLQSGRPRCVVAMHTLLRLEHVRWRSALDNSSVSLVDLRQLPTNGRLQTCSDAVRQSFIETLRISGTKFALDEKMQKLLDRRILELSGHPKHPQGQTQQEQHQVVGQMQRQPQQQPPHHFQNDASHSSQPYVKTTTIGNSYTVGE